MAKKVPKVRGMNIQLAVAGMQLTNELKRQFSEGTVKTYGQMQLGRYHLHPGEIQAVVVTNRITEAIEKGWIELGGDLK